MAKFIKATGTVEWAKIFPQNMDTADKVDHPKVKEKLEKCGGEYSMNFYPDDPDGFAAELEANGIDMAPMGHKRMKEKDGRVFTKLARKHIGPFEEAGGPPKVVDDDKNPWNMDENGEIGNDSKVGVVLEKYGSNIRLAAVQVLELVEFESPDVEDMLDF